MTRIKDVMVKDVVTCDGAATLLEALELMISRRVKSVVVPPKHDHDPYGVITFTDVVRKALAEDEQIELLNVFDVMSRPAYSVQPEWDVRHAAAMMVKLHISRVIVTDNGKLAGMVSMSDLVHSLPSLRKLK